MNAILQEAQDDLKSATEALDLYAEELRVSRKAEFVAAGGCTRCGGRQWVVTWDTLDALDGSYAEYESCSCEKKAFPADFDRSYYSKYDGNRGVTALPLACTLSEGAKWGELKDVVQTANTLVDSLRAALDPMVKGKRVRVYKGRKVPVGTEGVVFWMGTRVVNLPYGRKTENRLGLHQDDQTVVWVSADNCEGVLTVL